MKYRVSRLVPSQSLLFSSSSPTALLLSPSLGLIREVEEGGGETGPIREVVQLALFGRVACFCFASLWFCSTSFATPFSVLFSFLISEIVFSFSRHSTKSGQKEGKAGATLTRVMIHLSKCSSFQIQLHTKYSIRPNQAFVSVNSSGLVDDLKKEIETRRPTEMEERSEDREVQDFLPNESTRERTL